MILIPRAAIAHNGARLRGLISGQFHKIVIQMRGQVMTRQKAAGHEKAENWRT